MRECEKFQAGNRIKTCWSLTDGKFDAGDFLMEPLKLNKTSTDEIQTVVAEVAICSNAH